MLTKSPTGTRVTAKRQNRIDSFSTLHLVCSLSALSRDNKGRIVVHVGDAKMSLSSAGSFMRTSSESHRKRKIERTNQKEPVGFFTLHFGTSGFLLV